MGVTIFTTGSVVSNRDNDGREILRIDFGPDAPGTYGRHELPSGARLQTTGAIAETFGRGETVLEVVSLDELRVRFADKHVLSTREAATGILDGDPDEATSETASGGCTREYDPQDGLYKCVKLTCSGECQEKSILIFTYCSCQ